MPSGASTDRRPLSERWRPTSLAEMVGNPRARAELTAWADGWSGDAPPGRRAVILVGPPGVGKTTAATALALERGWALVEMNASEARNAGAIERVAGRASITHALDAGLRAEGKQRTLVLLDEADCLSGGRTTEGAKASAEPVPLRTFLEGRYRTIDALNRAWGLESAGKTRPFESWASLPRTPGNYGWAKLPAARRDLEDWRASARVAETGDRGGLGAIVRLVRSTRQPLVLTANDDRPLTRYSAVFRTSARTVRFSAIPRDALAERLGVVARAEHLELRPEIVRTIVERAQGDLRAALNDLEAVAPLPDPSAQRELLGGRDRASDFEELTEEVLSRPRYYRSVEVRDRLDAPPDDLLPWIEENVPFFAPDPEHREAALGRVAAADLMLSRARRWRTYGLWSYAGEVMTGGVSLAIRETAAPGAGSAAFPRFLGMMGFSRSARAVRDGLASKLGARLHHSRRKGRAVSLPFTEALFETIARSPRNAPVRATGRALARELGLTAEEVAGLLGVRPDSEAVLPFLPAPEEEASLEETPTDATEGARARSPAQRQLGDWGGG